MSIHNWYSREAEILRRYSDESNALFKAVVNWRDGKFTDRLTFTSEDQQILLE